MVRLWCYIVACYGLLSLVLFYICIVLYFGYRIFCDELNSVCGLYYIAFPFVPKVVNGADCW